MTHFLDEAGNIPKQMPKEARELANFLALVVDETTKKSSSSVIHTSIRCFKKKCEGTINSEFSKENNEIKEKAGGRKKRKIGRRKVSGEISSKENL